MVRFGFMILWEVPPSCYGLAKVLTSMGSIVTLAHHPYWRSFHTFACLIRKLLEDSGLFASIPLTARSRRSFCRCAKSDIGIVFTCNDAQEDLVVYFSLMPYLARVERKPLQMGGFGIGGIRPLFPPM